MVLKADYADAQADQGIRCLYSVAWRRISISWKLESFDQWKLHLLLAKSIKYAKTLPRVIIIIIIIIINTICPVQLSVMYTCLVLWWPGSGFIKGKMTIQQ